MGNLFLLATAESLRDWSLHLGGLGLILLGLADNTPFVSAPPGSMDIAVIALSAGRPESWAWYAFMATVCEVLGGYLTYRLAARGGKETLEKKIGESRAARLYGHFEKHGFGVVIAASILPPPFPFTSVVMAAGIMQYPAKDFLPALAAGRAVRFFAVAGLARIYSHQTIALFTRYQRPALFLLIAIAITAGIGTLIVFLRRRRRKRA